MADADLQAAPASLSDGYKRRLALAVQVPLLVPGPSTGALAGPRPQHRCPCWSQAPVQVPLLVPGPPFRTSPARSRQHFYSVRGRAARRAMLLSSPSETCGQGGGLRCAAGEGAGGAAAGRAAGGAGLARPC